MSDLKGGKLAKLAFPAKVIGLILSDIIDDPIDLVSGVLNILFFMQTQIFLLTILHNGLFGIIFLCLIKNLRDD